MDQPLSVPASTGKPLPSEPTASARWLSTLLQPVRAFRLIYLPLVMVFFAYGASGIIDVTRDMWIKEQLTLSPTKPSMARCVRPQQSCRSCRYGS